MADAYPTGGAPYQQEPLTVNQGYSPNIAPGSNATYTTPFNCIVCCIVVTFFIIGTTIFIVLLAIGLSNDSTTLTICSICPLIFTLIAIIFGIRFNISSTITIDNNLQTVFITSKKICTCCSKSNSLKISDIKQVIAQIDSSTHYEINDVPYNAFEIIFDLVDGRQITGCTGVIDKDGEAQRAISILRNSLPSNIIFIGDLTNQDLQNY